MDSDPGTSTTKTARGSAADAAHGPRVPQLGAQRPSRSSIVLTKLARFAAAAAFGGCILAFAAYAQGEQVLLLTDTGAAPWEGLVTARVRETLLRNRGNVQVFVETLDIARSPAVEQQAAVAEFLNEKYSASPIDAAVVVGPSSLAFLAERRATLFPESPIVYGGVGASNVPADIPGSTGVVSSFDLVKTVDLALSLQPDARRLVVITGADALDREWNTVAHERLDAYRGRLELTYLAGLPKAELLAELRRLSSDTIVLLLAMRQDGAGEIFDDGPALARELAAAAAAPTYSVFKAYVGEGVVGGYVESTEAIADSMAALTLRLLSGERPADMPPVQSVSVSAVDSGALRRFNLDEASLPPDTQVLLREPALWQRYSGQALGIVALAVLSALTIVALLLYAGKRRAERALQQTEDRYRHVVDSQIDLICRYAPDTTLTFVNDAYCRYFGRAHAELLGHRFIDLIPEADRPRVLERVRSLVAEIRTVSYMHQATMADGSVRWQQWLDHPIVDAQGKVVEVQSIGRDITELKAAEAEAQQRREQVTHLTRVAILGELSGALAHELNQPMTAILSNAQTAERLLLQDAPDLVELREIVKDIVADDVRAGDVIRRLRTMLKPGGTAFQLLDISALLAEVVVLVRAQLLDHHVTLVERFAGPLPPVHGDRVQLQQVLLNLLMNACEAMRANEPSDRTLIARAAYENGFVRVSVADSGPGITPQVSERLFEPFFTTKTEGLGLGLSICRSIVSLHSGWISARNNSERGATVEFVLPVAQPEAEQDDHYRPVRDAGFVDALRVTSGM